MLNIDLAALRAGKASYAEVTKDITYSDLHAETNEVFSTIQSIIKDATDADVTFVPADPQAGEGEHGWTLSHVIAHLTASFEEGAASSALLSRGFVIEQRLHTETPWESLSTIEQVRARLEESSRICHAYLDAWPNNPNLEVTSVRVSFMGPMNSIGGYVLGLLHAQMHYEQLKEIMSQAKAS